MLKTWRRGTKVMGRKVKSWNEMEDSELEYFLQKLDSLLEELPRDEKGDSPVEVEVVDRRRFERLRYSPVPYVTKDNLKEVEEEVVYNLSVASEDYKRFLARRRLLENVKDDGMSAKE
jgi:hypothetical protein